MLTIQRKISLINFSKGNNPKYIVIHDVGALGQAWANANYFYNVFRNASAGYFVDDDNILQVVEDFNVSWHVGDDKDDSDDGINNYNSIGIEMCLNPSWKVTEKTKQNTIDLVKYLQKKHNIPNSRVVRHFDASGKRCPGSMASNNWAEWKAFYARICGTTATVPVTTTPVSNPTVSTGNGKLVKINTDVLNVRSGAGTEFKVNRQLTRGGLYTIVETVNGWGRLKSGAGWISMDYVVDITGVVAEAITVEKPKLNVWNDERGTFSPYFAINVRVQPNTKSAIVAQYNKGETLTYNAWLDDGHYIWIRYTGASGLSRYMVQKENDVAWGKINLL